MKQEFEKKQLLNDNDPAFGTYISNETEISSDTERLLRNSKQSRTKFSSFLPDTILQKKLITLRSTLLALSLTLTLFVFWLLDSLKDPVFATLVDGNLKKHQPLAKMASVGSTLVLVLFMEFVSHERNKRIRHEDVEILSKDDVLNGGGIWTRMNVGSSEIDGKVSQTTDSEDSGQIPFAVFKIVGICYTIAFCLISYVLRQHRSFSNNLIPTMDQSEHAAWYIIGYLQYITIESFGSIGVATFWSFTNSSLSLTAAKSYYGFIIACAQLGAIGGSTVATSSMSIPNLFVFACFGIASQMIVMHIYGMYFPQPMSEEDDRPLSHMPSQNNDYEFELSKKTGKKVKKSDHHIHRDDSMSFISGVYLILRHNYLILILGVSCLYEISLTCLDYEMKLIGLERFSSPPELVEDSSNVFSDNDASAFATFMGRYGQLTNVLSLLISYYAFPYLIENHGLKNTLRIFPSLLVLVTVTTFVALPMNLPVLFVSMSLLKALTYSINDPAKEILYIPTSNAVKFKAKFWIDVVGARVAKAIGSTIGLGAGTAERIVTYGSLPSVITAVTLWLVCFSVGMEFDRLLMNGEIIGCEEEYEQCHSYDSVDSKEDTGSFPEASYDYDESICESHVSIELIQHNR
jgi:ATP/ADP translocase